MDLDIEMDVDMDEGQYNAAIPEAYTHDIITGEEQEPGEVDEDLEGTEQKKDTSIVPYKIHIRGLDTFNPDDVKAYVAQHHGAGQFERIEWIDDSSANLLFKTESAATEALVALSTLDIVDPSSLPPLEALPAKQYAAKPDSVLQVRFAVEGDKKATGAAEKSRFYLLHPEYDPEERRRRGELGSRRYRDRDDSYRGNRRGGRDGRRRDDDRQEDTRGLTFDASLYDDDSSALAQRSSGRRDEPQRQRSTSSGSVRSDRYRPNSRQNREKELFPGRLNSTSHRDRARSASPGRDRDGDAHMGEDDNARAATAMRNREKGRSIKERLAKETTSRESTPRELFPEKSHASKELFPSKVSLGSGSKAQMDRVDDNTILASAKLADRITARPTSTTSIPQSGGDGLNIRGLADRHGGSRSGSRGDGPGIAVKGKGATVKELFPDKFGSNAAKELFAEKLEGRGRRRQKAEDMFY